MKKGEIQDAEPVQMHDQNNEAEAETKIRVKSNKLKKSLCL